MQDFVHLHVHTQYSILDGQASISKLVDKAIADGMKGIAVTDHGVAQAFPDMWKAGKKNGVKIGLEKGTVLITQKSIDCKAVIQKFSKDFGGPLDDPEVIKLCGCSRNSYYKYKKEIKVAVI